MEAINQILPDEEGYFHHPFLDDEAE